MGTSLRLLLSGIDEPTVSTEPSYQHLFRHSFPRSNDMLIYVIAMASRYSKIAAHAVQWTTQLRLHG